ncbi:hypothetical protein [Levilactobacillus brevis]|uniref:hypothetical protein n=1 Tax=Levilactobacillus brevis TaxID=1580 RepID=UPI000B3EA47D|nr:hypothetical protein [Levilactobacillus brevis]ARW21827.1 hypothetical protein S101174_00984 [Levilactobacillus brevis]
MNMAQMETFQYVLQHANELGNKKYQLVFLYKGDLYTGNFYKTIGADIQWLQSYTKENGFIAYIDHSVNTCHMVYQVEYGNALDTFDKVYLGLSNINRSEVLFTLIKNFISEQPVGDSTSNYIYDLKSLTTGIKLDFIEINSNDQLSPVSLFSNES